jgi:hypothetical protein
MPEDNKKIVDVLELLLFDNTPEGVEIAPFLFFQKSHVTDSNFTFFDIQSILKKLRLKKYLQEINMEEFKKTMVYELEDKAKDYVKQAEELGEDPLKTLSDAKAYLEKHGFRMEDFNPEETGNIFEHPDFDKNINDTFLENFSKSKTHEAYRITGDLFKLIQDLKNGRDFEDIRINYPDLTYNPRTTELFLLDENPIKISKYKLNKNQHSKVLKALFENGKDKEHKFLDLMEQKVLPKKITSSDYYKICQEINKKKVAKATKNRIADFLLFSMDSVQINPKYSKKLHQLTLQIT